MKSIQAGSQDGAILPCRTRVPEVVVRDDLTDTTHRPQKSFLHTKKCKIHDQQLHF